MGFDLETKALKCPYVCFIEHMQIPVEVYDGKKHHSARQH